MPQEFKETALPDSGRAQNQTPAEETSATQNANDKKPVNSKTYRVLGKAYAIFCIIIALIIIIAPQSWLSIPVLAKIMKIMIPEMPGLVYLAGLSKSPEDTAAALFLPVLTSPLHFTLLTTMAVSRYNNGFFDPINFRKSVKWGWIFPLGFWVIFFTCMFCFADPNWRDLVLVSSRGIIAIFQLGFVVAAVAYPAIILATLLGWLKRKLIEIRSGDNNHA